MNKISVMFICHGNICRSPMAEFMFKQLVQNKGCSHWFIINSSATSNEEIWGGVGNPIYPPAKRELERRGVPFTDHRATQLKKSDYGLYDYFLVMDSSNYSNAIRIFGGDPENKVKKLLYYANENRDVSDPWYSGDFSTCFNDIMLGVECFWEYLTEF